jgi:VWFA-related protein
MRKFGVFALAILLAVVSLAQDSQFQEAVEVRLHNLDVIVTDRQGRQVRNLTQADFVVTENGQRQEITNFATYDTSRVSASKPAQEAVAAPAEAAPAAPPRTFAFFIDEIEVQRSGRNQLIESMTKMLDGMRPGDNAVVVRPTGETNIVQNFTGDRAAVEQALRKAINESKPSGSRGPAAELRNLQRDMQRKDPFARKRYATDALRRVQQRLGQLRALVGTLSAMEGKKLLVIVSAGLTATPGSDAYPVEERMALPAGIGERDAVALAMYQAQDATDAEADEINEALEPGSVDEERVRSPFDMRPAIDDLARTAATNGVTIYAIEPDVPLPLYVRGAADAVVIRRQDRSFGEDPKSRPANTLFVDFLANSAVTLTSLTEKTGGRWFRGLNEIDDTFEQVTEDLGFYYSIAYRAEGEENMPRQVKVGVRNRPDLVVRTRTEVVDKSIDRAMEDRVVASLVYPRESNDLGIELRAGTPEKDRGLRIVSLETVIPLDKLLFLEGGDGRYHAAFTVHYAATGEEQDFGAGSQQEQKVSLSKEEYAQRANIRYRHQSKLQIAATRTRIAIGVLDVTARTTGFQVVEVR